MVYFKINQNKIELGEMGTVTGNDKFNEFYKEILDVFKKHDN